MSTSKVSRHSLTVRLTHWVVALSGLALVFSGFGALPMYGRYNLAKIPGLHWTGDFGIQLVLHYVMAIFFTAAIFFHLVFHLRRREFAALPKKGDLKESVEIVKAMVTGDQEPPSGKFLAEQRLAYAAIGLASVVLVVTGLIKTYKNAGIYTLDPRFLQSVTLTHTLATLIFMILFLFHVAAFLIRANRPLLESMFTGKVRRDYAEHRHSKWEIR